MAESEETSKEERSTRSLDLVLLPVEKLQEVLDDAVRRGRMTRGDAEELLSSLVGRGRRNVEEIVSAIDDRMSSGRESLESGLTDALHRVSDDALQTVDRVRRATGLGPAFPILGYDDLTASEVTQRLDHLAPPELRKVRDHESRNANRVTVLRAIERKLK